MELSSAVRIRRPAAEVFDALLDAGKVAACLPGSHLIGEVADGTYAGQIELTIGPIDAVYAGTVRLDAADRNTGTVTLSASGRERAGQGSADAHVAVRVEPDGAGARVLISADLMIRGTVAQYAPGRSARSASDWWNSSPVTSSDCWPARPARAPALPPGRPPSRRNGPRRRRSSSVPGCSPRWLSGG